MHIESNLFRPSDLRQSCANPEKAVKQLGWKAQTKFEEVVIKMAEAANEDVRGVYE